MRSALSRVAPALLSGGWLLSQTACPVERTGSEESTADPWASEGDAAGARPVQTPSVGAEGQGRPPEAGTPGAEAAAPGGMVRVGRGFLLVGGGAAPEGTGPQGGPGAVPTDPGMREGGGPGGPGGDGTFGGGPGGPGGDGTFGGAPMGQQGPGSGGREGEPPPGEGGFPHIEATPAAPASVVGKRTLVIDADPTTKGAAPAPIRVAGYLLVQFDDTGMPRPHATSTWSWQGVPSAWPVRDTVDVPTDGRSWLVAWADADQDGRVDPKERISSPLAPVPPDDPASPAAEPAEVHFRIDRVASGPVGVRGYGAWSQWKAIIDGDADTASVSESSLLLVGYAPEALTQEGFPSREGRPMLQWTSPDKKRTWPQEVYFEVPENQTPVLFAILDINGDGHLSPGDRLGSSGSPIDMVPPAQGYRLVIDQVLPGGDAPSTPVGNAASKIGVGCGG